MPVWRDRGKSGNSASVERAPLRLEREGNLKKKGATNTSRRKNHDPSGKKRTTGEKKYKSPPSPGCRVRATSQHDGGYLRVDAL